MNKQGYNQMRTPVFNQQNNKNLENRPKINKNILKLCPTSIFKATISTKIDEAIQSSTAVNKYRFPKCKTQQNSPINQRTNSNKAIRFPDLYLASNILSKRQVLLKQSHTLVQRDAAKTAIINDSLMKYIKDQSEPRHHFRQQKRVINLMDQCNEFIQCEPTKRSCKKPKIVKNQITKMFFEDNKEKSRKTHSEDRCRKAVSNNSMNEKISEYTFYGGSRKTLNIQTQDPISSKNELNEMRIAKLSKKHFDFNEKAC